MEQFFMIGFGLAMSYIMWFSLDLSYWIALVEDNKICEKCNDITNCFAKKKLHLYGFHTESDYMSEWMLLSFLKVRKQCSNVKNCSVKNKIICFAFSFIAFMVTFWSKGLDAVALLYGISTMTLLFLSVVDWNTQYIPMECNIIIFICGLIHLFADFSNWGDYLIGLIAVSGFLFLVDRIATPVLAKRYQGEEIDSVIGDGDIKLMAATGLLLGWKLNFLALGIGCIAGSVIHLIRMKIKGSNTRLALGPYLSLGVYITMICGEQLVSWYLGWMGYIPYQ